MNDIKKDNLRFIQLKNDRLYLISLPDNTASATPLKEINKIIIELDDKIKDLEQKLSEAENEGWRKGFNEATAEDRQQIKDLIDEHLGRLGICDNTYDQGQLKALTELKGKL